MSSQRIKALDTRTVADLAGVPLSTLNNWTAAKLCKPSLLGPAGQRITRYWHPRDVVVVRAIRSLRNAGCPMKLLKRVNKYITEEWDRTSSTRTLLYDGSDIYWVDDIEARLVSGGRLPGQALFPLSIHVAAIPVRDWIANIKDLGTEIDIAEERRVRQKRAAARARARATRSFSA